MMLNLDLLDGAFAVVRLGPDDPVPAWARGGALWSITQTPEELSILCASDRVPPSFHDGFDPWKFVLGTRLSDTTKDGGLFGMPFE